MRTANREPRRDKKQRSESNKPALLEQERETYLGFFKGRFHLRVGKTAHASPHRCEWHRPIDAEICRARHRSRRQLRRNQEMSLADRSGEFCRSAHESFMWKGRRCFPLLEACCLYFIIQLFLYNIYCNDFCCDIEYVRYHKTDVRYSQQFTILYKYSCITSIALCDFNHPRTGEPRITAPRPGRRGSSSLGVLGLAAAGPRGPRSCGGNGMVVERGDWGRVVAWRCLGEDGRMVSWRS